MLRGKTPMDPAEKALYDRIMSEQKQGMVGLDKVLFAPSLTYKAHEDFFVDGTAVNWAKIIHSLIENGVEVLASINYDPTQGVFVRRNTLDNSFNTPEIPNLEDMSTLEDLIQKNHTGIKGTIIQKTGKQDGIFVKAGTLVVKVPRNLTAKEQGYEILQM